MGYLIDKIEIIKDGRHTRKIDGFLEVNTDSLYTDGASAVGYKADFTHKHVARLTVSCVFYSKPHNHDKVSEDAKNLLIGSLYRDVNLLALRALTDVRGGDKGGRDKALRRATQNNGR